ncbi:hypothetical protein ACL6C3_01645 [Capilliphycus salinus ALCB114379]|uniref:hypothetical protein n=1 Tax=Capilliphycus salinus TaxID=2768948 RepID=UPI0039A6521D
MSTLLALLIVFLSSSFCVVFIVWPSYAFHWLHLPQWTALLVLGLLLSWLMGE